MSDSRTNGHNSHADLKIEGTLIEHMKAIYQDDQVRNYVLTKIMAKGCTKQQALDLFQDAMIVIVHKFRGGDLEKIHASAHYVYRIVFNMWLNKYRKKKEAALEDISIEPEDENAIEQFYAREDQNKLLESVLKLVSAKCRQLLRAQQMGYTTEEVADLMQFVSTDRVRKEKYRCLSRLKAKLSSNQEVLKLAKELDYSV